MLHFAVYKQTYAMLHFVSVCEQIIRINKVLFFFCPLCDCSFHIGIWFVTAGSLAITLSLM